MMDRAPLRANHSCRHYGFDRTRGEPVCGRGVDLTDVTAGRCCLSKPMDLCIRREEFTDAEREAWHAHTQRSAERYAIILAAIPGSGDPRDKAYWGTHGTITCPVCGGTVRYSRARRNGHLHAACSTPGCFAVMQ